MVSQKSRDTFFSLRKNTSSISHQKKQPKITFFLKRSCEQFSKYSAFSLCAKTLPNNRDKFRGFFNHPADGLTFFMRDLHFADLHAPSISQARFVQFRSEHSAQRLVDIYLLHDRSNPFRMKGALLYRYVVLYPCALRGFLSTPPGQRLREVFGTAFRPRGLHPLAAL